MISPEQTPRYYDKQTNLNWHRKVDQHPDPSVNSLAEEYGIHLALQLQISPPKIYWFEEADFDEAKKVWCDCSGKRGQPTDDPLKDTCEYFRWRNPSGRPEPAIFAGYTHRESPLGIMINVCRRGEGLLRTIAHESYHIYQDVIHGSGWRATNAPEIEPEASRFEESKAEEIRAFLERQDRAAH